MGATDKARRVRLSYEKRPYPARLILRGWPIAPLEWIEAMWRPRQPLQRILIAGCGTGAEAFAFRRKFPKATIVAVDFSRRSIALAQSAQRKMRSVNKVRFVRADLASRSFVKEVSGEFDLISCHGVLTYVEQAGLALRNFAGCLREGGVLYLGVNGAGHYSERWRHALPSFGFDPSSFREHPKLRPTLALFDAISGHAAGSISNQTPDYLASDLFTPIMFNRSLPDWLTLCRDQGWFFHGSLHAQLKLRMLLNRELYEGLLPRSRPEVHELVEQLSPSSFHCLVFAREPCPRPPWQSQSTLEKWRLAATKMYRLRKSKPAGRASGLQSITLENRQTNTAVDLLVPRWVLKILEGKECELRTFLAQRRAKISSRDLCQHLYLLYLLAAVNLLPPAGIATRPAKAA